MNQRMNIAEALMGVNLLCYNPFFANPLDSAEIRFVYIMNCHRGASVRCGTGCDDEAQIRIRGFTFCGSGDDGR